MKTGETSDVVRHGRLTLKLVAASRLLALVFHWPRTALDSNRHLRGGPREPAGHGSVVFQIFQMSLISVMLPSMAVFTGPDRAYQGRIGAERHRAVEARAEPARGHQMG